MNFILQPWHLAVVLVSAWVNHRQQQSIAFQNDQIESLLEKLGKKLPQKREETLVYVAAYRPDGRNVLRM